MIFYIQKQKKKPEADAQFGGSAQLNNPPKNATPSGFANSGGDKPKWTKKKKGIHSH